mmetsp:Transcript_116087/g.205572  ORF Transcript_116087/g.205572 Transcript_116087/m.205572 type:complete len:147 (-) Transcript_116087:98-538(-)
MRRAAAATLAASLRNGAQAAGGASTADRASLAVHLAEALSDEDAQVRHSVAAALRKLGAAAHPQAAALAEALRDNDARVRRAAAKALQGIGAAGTAPHAAALAEALNDADVKVQRAAAEALRAAGSAVEMQATSVEQELADSDGAA